MSNIKNTIRMGIIAATGAAAMVACSDTWSDHYDTAPVTSYKGTTLQAIQEKAPDFAEIIKLVGYDRELASENVYTIWAPEHFNKDSVLAVAETDPEAVMEKFVKNHIARYAVSQNGSEQRITLMSQKFTTMTGRSEEAGSQGTFGSTEILVKNLSCDNGVLHIIKENIPFHNNVFEQIQEFYNPATDDISLYSFLKKWDADSLDENKSVSHGVDADGNNIWVDSVMIRNNTVLKSVDAIVYDEDSSYIAIVPTAEAYAERYNIAKELLKFNPYEDTLVDGGGACDSLQDHYANLFAMNDLFYNKNANEHWEDSLKSTNYSAFNWPNHLYYSKEPYNGLPKDKGVNNILAKSGSPIVCSNGEVYLVDEYPMSVEEQFYYKLTVGATTRSLVGLEEKPNGVEITKNISGNSGLYMGPYYVMDEEEEEGDITLTEYTYQFLDVAPPNSNVNIEAGFKIPNTLSGTYDLYIVTSPIWLKDSINAGTTIGSIPEEGMAAYKFRVAVYQKSNDASNLKTVGQYTTTNTALTDPVTGTNYFVSDPTNVIDTLHLGSFTFNNAYYGRDEEGVILKVTSNVSSSELRNGVYSREMLITGFILRPKMEEIAEEAKRK